MKASQDGLSLPSPETSGQLSQRDHNLLYVHCIMKPTSWSAAASNIKKIDDATGVQRIISQKAMIMALKRWDFATVVDKHDQIQREDDRTWAEDHQFMLLSMQDETSKFQREKIDRALGLDGTATKS
jgi:hypothetical protein